MNTITVPFHGQELYLINHNGEPYTPMKPICENMGLNWASQYRKLTSNIKRWGVVKMTIPTAGDLQEAICLPLRKLFGWLATISPNKVKPELSDKVRMYQEECDDVLWRYWTNQQKTDSEQREPLIRACEKLAVGNTIRSGVYTMVANRFGYDKPINIPASLLPEAVAFVYEEILARQNKDRTIDRANAVNAYTLAVHMNHCKSWFDTVREPLEALNPALVSSIKGQFDEGASTARMVQRGLSVA